MLGTVITLELLLYFYYSPSPHPKTNVEAFQEATQFLLDKGLIEPYDRHFITTLKGKFFVDFLLRVPLPETTFTVPGSTNPKDGCVWTQDSDFEMGDTYDSGCGEKWSFIEGGPKENNVRFCQGCGKPVVIASAQPQQKEG